MTARLLGDVVVLAHVAFVAFVVFGGLFVLRRPRVAVPHVAAVAWGVLVELAGITCPLTPLENRLRESAGDTPYAGDFIDHYVLPFLYPDGLTRDAQVGLGLAALALNLVVYGYVLRARWPSPWSRAARRR